MRIGAPEISVHNGEVTYAVTVNRSTAGQEQLWYRLSARYRSMVSDRADAAVVALLIPAMKDGTDIIVDGPVTDELVFNINNEYQTILRSAIPGLKRVTVHASRECPTEPAAEGVATGFSAGVDSYAVLADHFLNPHVPHSLRLTHLLYNNVGSHGTGGEATFQRRLARAKQTAVTLGLELISVNSNMDQFYFGRFSFQQTHTPRNSSVPLLLQSGIGKFLYASTVPFANVGVREAYDLSVCDPISLPVLSTTAVEMRSSGSQYTRVEKTLRVAEVPESHSSLDVCVSPDGDPNCSVCWKCMRTELTLDIAGLLHRYSSVFDIPKYQAARRRYIPSILLSRDPLLKEVVAFAGQRDYKLPTAAYAIAPVLEVLERSKKKAKPPIKRVLRAVKK